MNIKTYHFVFDLGGVIADDIFYHKSKKLFSDTFCKDCNQDLLVKYEKISSQQMESYKRSKIPNENEFWISVYEKQDPKFIDLLYDEITKKHKKEVLISSQNFFSSTYQLKKKELEMKDLTNAKTLKGKINKIIRYSKFILRKYQFKIFFETIALVSRLQRLRESLLEIENQEFEKFNNNNNNNNSDKKKTIIKIELGIISNHSSEWFWEIFERFRLDKIFDEKNVIVSCDHGIAKPDKEIYDLSKKTLTKNHNKKNVNYEEIFIFIDDKKRNTDAAIKNGFQHAIIFDSRKLKVQVLQEKFEKITGLKIN